MDYVLQTQELCKSYRSFKALDHLQMHIPKGSIYGMSGKNGAGKTTLIRLITGLQNPSEGRYQLFGVDHTNPLISKARKRTGAVVETPSIYLDLSARENMIQQYMTLGIPSFKGIDELLTMTGLADTGKRKAKDFSLGMRQRLGIAIALAGNPDFLVLDEPMNGLDPQGIIEIRELILNLNRENGITILISSHILDELSRVATHYGFIDHGRMVKEISAQQLEEKCARKTRVTVSDLNGLIRTMDDLQLCYEIISDTEAEIFDDIEIHDLVLNADKYGCRIRKVNMMEESLESYYLNLIGGDLHD